MPSKPTPQSYTKMPTGINIDYGNTYPFTTKSNVIQKEDDSPLKVSTVEEKPKSDTKLLTHLKDTVPTQQVGETNVKPIVPETTVTETKPAVSVLPEILMLPISDSPIARLPIAAQPPSSSNSDMRNSFTQISQSCIS